MKKRLRKKQARKREGRTGKGKSKEFGNARTTGLARKQQTSNKKQQGVYQEGRPLVLEGPLELISLQVPIQE